MCCAPRLTRAVLCARPASPFRGRNRSLKATIFVGSLCTLPFSLPTSCGELGQLAALPKGPVECDPRLIDLNVLSLVPPYPTQLLRSVDLPSHGCAHRPRRGAARRGADNARRPGPCFGIRTRIRNRIWRTLVRWPTCRALFARWIGALIYSLAERHYLFTSSYIFTQPIAARPGLRSTGVGCGTT